ncbi:MAG: hypothetical protein ACOYBY_16045 [Dermatophilaceae bacterium]
MPTPSVLTEPEALAAYLQTQLTAIRTATYGLTEAQIRETPCRSALSLGGWSSTPRTG